MTFILCEGIPLSCCSLLGTYRQYAWTRDLKLPSLTQLLIIAASSLELGVMQCISFLETSLGWEDERNSCCLKSPTGTKRGGNKLLKITQHLPPSKSSNQSLQKLSSTVLFSSSKKNGLPSYKPVPSQGLRIIQGRFWSPIVFSLSPQLAGCELLLSGPAEASQWQ